MAYGLPTLNVRSHIQNNATNKAIAPAKDLLKVLQCNKFRVQVVINAAHSTV